MEAVKWYRKAAEQGNAAAQANLGYCYQNGQGVVQDYDEAVKWYRKAAAQGDALGQRNFGVCFQNGWGVPRDYNEAVKWYRKAAEQGHADAANQSWYMLSHRPRGATRLGGRRLKWYRKAAEQGYRSMRNAILVIAIATAKACRLTSSKLTNGFN